MDILIVLRLDNQSDTLCTMSILGIFCGWSMMNSAVLVKSIRIYRIIKNSLLGFKSIPWVDSKSTIIMFAALILLQVHELKLFNSPSLKIITRLS